MDGTSAARFGASLNPAKGSDVFSMQISVKLAALFSFVFAAVCLWFAVDAFKSLADMSDPAQAAGAGDFVWFWSFLAVVGVVLGVVSWKLAERQTED
jgi:hypothetical protein